MKSPAHPKSQGQVYEAKIELKWFLGVCHFLNAAGEHKDWLGPSQVADGATDILHPHQHVSTAVTSYLSADFKDTRGWAL